MGKSRAIVVILLFAHIGIFQICHGRNCHELGVTFYESLGCTQKSVDSDGCPSEFDCNISQSNDSCYFRGEYYKEGDTVFPSNAPCNGNCTCGIFQGKPRFSCHGDRCNLEDLTDSDLGNDCYRYYQPHSCCPSEKRCRGVDDIRKCVVDGVEFDEGTGMRPNTSCSYCTCTKDGPVCSPEACADWAQMYLQESIQNYCAPVYLKDGSFPKGLLCCMRSFICPDGTQEIVSASEKNPEGKTCKFGSQILDFGDYFYEKTGYAGIRMWKLKCECQLPPFVTCYEE